MLFCNLKLWGQKRLPLKKYSTTQKIQIFRNHPHSYNVVTISFTEILNTNDRHVLYSAVITQITNQNAMLTILSSLSSESFLNSLLSSHNIISTSVPMNKHITIHPNKLSHFLSPLSLSSSILHYKVILRLA